MIVGKWEWVATINAWTGIKYTPETEGFTKTTVYKNDHTVEYYKNEDLVAVESYEIMVIVRDPKGPNSRLIDLLIVNETEVPFSIRNDTLTFNQAYVDGPTSSYIRIE